MGLIDVDLMEDLLHSSSIEKGIERTMERMINELEIDSMYIIRQEDEGKVPEMMYDWDAIDNRELYPLDEYVENMNNWGHFDEDEIFVARATQVLSESEKERYHYVGYESVVEYRMTNHGNLIGYIAVGWNKINDLSDEQVNDIHILCKLMNELLIKEFHKDILGESEASLFRLTSSMTNTAIYMLDENKVITYINRYAKETYPNIKLGEDIIRAIWGDKKVPKNHPLMLIGENESVAVDIYLPYLDGDFHVVATSVKKADSRMYYVMTLQKRSSSLEDNKKQNLANKFVDAMRSLYKDMIAVEIRKDSFYDLFSNDVMTTNSYSMDFVLKWLNKVHLDDKKKFIECFDVNFLQNAYMAGDKKKEIDFRYRTHEGNYHCMNGQILFEQNSNKEVTVYILFQDVEQVRSLRIEEERKMRESVLAARSAAELKTEVLSNISHEIRTPISGIISMSSVARQVYKNEERLLECLSNIDNYADHMTTVMDRILEVINVDRDAITITKNPFQLESFLNRIDVTTREKAEKKNIDFSVKFYGQYTQLLGDSVRLQQALFYLINNSLLYTPNGGKLMLTAKQVAVDKKTVFIRFILDDTGSGLTDKMKESIFGFVSETGGVVEEQYFDLSLASKLVNMMGGQIGVEVNSTGTHLNFTIPFELQAGVAKKATKKKLSAVAGTFEGKKILLAEDSELSQDALRAVLEVAGFEVDTVDNGRRAVVQFVSKPATTYDAILMDVHMPQMDGREATKCIRISGKEDAESIPIIGLMADTHDEDVEQSIQSGMQEHLGKPVDVDTLYKVLHRLLPEKDDE